MRLTNLSNQKVMSTATFLNGNTLTFDPETVSALSEDVKRDDENRVVQRIEDESGRESWRQIGQNAIQVTRSLTYIRTQVLIIL